MKILIATTHKYLPQEYGGMQTSTDQLCRALIKRGYQVAVLSGFMHGGRFELRCRLQMKLNRAFRGCGVSRDTVCGYAIWRSWYPWMALAYVAEREKPNILMITSGFIVPMVTAAKPLKLPLLIQLNDVAFSYHGGSFEELRGIQCVANSHFTAQKYRECYGVEPIIIYPPIAPEQYRTATSKENVTFINPHPEKGRDLAVEIARLCPDIPFSFIEGWRLSLQGRKELVQRISPLANVTLRPAQNDMRRVYQRCRILLAPTVVEEGFGRVAVEAQISGIPVVASNRGGLAEAVGPGGILIDLESPTEGWVHAIRKLWSDPQYYSELSKAALAHAQRPELAFGHQIAQYEAAFKSVVAMQ